METFKGSPGGKVERIQSGKRKRRMSVICMPWASKSSDLLSSRRTIISFVQLPPDLIETNVAKKRVPWFANLQTFDSAVIRSFVTTILSFIRFRFSCSITSGGCSIFLQCESRVTPTPIEREWNVSILISREDTRGMLVTRMEYFISIMLTQFRYSL